MEIMVLTYEGYSKTVSIINADRVKLTPDRRALPSVPDFLILKTTVCQK